MATVNGQDITIPHISTGLIAPNDGLNPLSPGQRNGKTNQGNVVQDAINNVSGNLLTQLFGVTPARAGKALHQTLVGVAGASIIMLGFILIVSGTKTAQNLASTVTKIGATVAA